MLILSHIIQPVTHCENEVRCCCMNGSMYLCDRSVRRLCLSDCLSLPSARQHPSYGDCLEVKREYYQNCFMLGCVTQCSQSAAHSYEQFLQVQQIAFVTLGTLRHA